MPLRSPGVAYQKVSTVVTWSGLPRRVAGAEGI